MGGHIPEKLALFLHDKLDLKYAVETGTYKGDSTRFLVAEFEHVWSIEMDEGWYKRAVEVLGNEVSNLTLVHGNSGEKLSEVLKDVNGSALLWLDAHWCGGASGNQTQAEECPLMAELQAVRYGDVVLIDDARLFLGVPEYPHNPDHWPTLDEIVCALIGYRILVHNDVIIAVPAEALNIAREAIKHG